jgi:topoisomerase IV subunit A
MQDDTTNNTNNSNNGVAKVIHIDGMYQNWFLDYASYVILERAVPALYDGLKPVQRRIMHSFNELEDGRYNKVANVIGHCMKYHPHGDASIGEAITAIGQKDLLLDTQGNWGNILTGDRAAAARYIEARLSKFALEVVFNPKTTQWQSSYDGRNKEPINLPVKFPLLLAQGVEGIAVGLACKILPHNFIELIDASIDVLRGRKPNIFPDFVTGGQADFSLYNEGLRGGKVKVRAKIAIENSKTLKITEVPFGTTTSSLIDSILAANDKDKIKIRKIEDNTSENVEILVHLTPGISPDKTIDAMFAFTDCEISISPNSGVIENNTPKFLGVNEMLKISTHQTLELLKLELKIKKNELEENWHYSSLEKIFIEKRIYRNIEEAETWEAVISTIDDGLAPYKKLFKRAITEKDIVALTEIKIKRISKFDAKKADEHILTTEQNIKDVQAHLDNIVNYTIDYFKELKRKYGKGRERKTEIKIFGAINTQSVVIASEKLYVNRTEGFVGFALKKDEYIADCSTLDDAIVFMANGTMKVIRITDKVFVGKDILHVAVFKKGDEHTVYNLIYQDGPKGASYFKRFNVTGVTRDKEYDLSKGTKDSKILYFTANENGETEIINVQLKPHPSVRKTEFDIDFAQIDIKGRGVLGNVVTKMPIKKIVLKSKTASKTSQRMIWFDDTTQRLNIDGYGNYLGAFGGEDKIITINKSGHYTLKTFDLSNHFDDDLILIERLDVLKTISCVYFDGDKKEYILKRFKIDNINNVNKTLFVTEHADSHVLLVTTLHEPKIEVVYAKVKGVETPNEEFDLAQLMDTVGQRAKGKRLTVNKIKEVILLTPPPVAQEPVIETSTTPTTDFTPKSDDDLNQTEIKFE